LRRVSTGSPFSAPRVRVSHAAWPPPRLLAAATSHPPPSTSLILMNRLRSVRDLERRTKATSRRDPKKTKSLSSSRTSRSISPDGRRVPSHKSPKRRNTMNSRDTDVEMNRILDISRKEAERAGTLPDVDLDTNDGRRKRKRGIEAVDSVDNNRRKRSAGSPDSTPSDQLNGEGMRGKGSKTGNNTPVDTTDSNQGGRNRRSSRKDKEQGLDVDGKIKHPNQYTYRGPKPALASNSPAKQMKNDRSDHGSRRNIPQQSRGWSPSPAPVSYNIPDHFSHLATILPHPPQGVSVRIGPEEDNRVFEKGVKVRWPPKRTTLGEMRRRVRGMMEYVARAQLEAGERERRVEMLKAAFVSTQQPPSSTLSAQKEKGSIVSDGRSTGRDGAVEGIDGLKEKTEDATMVDTIPVPREAMMGDTAHLGVSNPLSGTPNAVISATSALSEKGVTAALTALEAERTSTVTSAVKKLPNIVSPKPTNGPTTMQLLDQLTRDLIEFQERFGAGREGKVYRDRTERERRTRAAVDVDIY